MQIDYKYHWSPSAGAWYIRAYRWMYRSYPSDFCHFFWGEIAFVPLLPVRVCVGLLEALRKSLPERPARQRDDELSVALDGAIETIATFGARVVFVIKRISTFVQSHRAIVWTLKVATYVVMGACGLLAVGLLVLAIVEGWPTTGYAGLGILAAGCLFGLLALVRNPLAAVITRVLDSLADLWDLLRIGYAAVKGSTCPKLEVRDAENIGAVNVDGTN